MEGIKWISENGENVLKSVLSNGDSPIYITSFWGNFLIKVSCRKNSDDVRVRIKETEIINESDIVDIITKSEDLQKTKIENSPFDRTDKMPSPVIPQNRAIRLGNSSDGENEKDTTLTDIIQLQNGSYVSILDEGSSVSSIPQSKVKELIYSDSKNPESLPRPSIGIPLNLLSY